MWLPVTQHDRVKGIIVQSDVLAALFEQEQSRTRSSEPEITKHGYLSKH